MPRGRRNSDGSKVGGSRSNAGRKLTDSEFFRMRLRRNTRIMIDRFAAGHGLKRKEGRAFWDQLFQLLLVNVTIPEPAYLQFIPQERTRMLSARTAE